MTQEIGALHLETIQAYIRDGGIIPVSARNGCLNLSELVRITGVPRSSFYQNAAIAKLVNDECTARGIQRQPVDDQARDTAPDVTAVGTPELGDGSKERRLERKVHRLESTNAALVAENGELRRQLKLLQLQLGREDMQIDSGRRIPPPVECK